MKTEKSIRNQSIILLLATTLIWGTSFILIKKAGQVFLPLEVGALRIVFGFIFLLPAFLLQRKLLPKKMWHWILLSGLLGSFIPSLLFAWAGSKIDSSLSGMLNATTPLFTVLIGIVFFKQKFSGRQWTGIIAGLAGALSLGLLQPHGIEVNAFVLPVVLATLLYALNVNLLKSKFSNVPPLALSAATIVAVGPAALVLLLGFTDFTTRLFTLPGALQAIGYVAVLGIFSTAIALVLFNQLIQIAGPLVASSVTYMMPVVSVMWGMIDGEPMGAGRIFGLIGILAGVYLVNRKS